VSAPLITPPRVSSRVARNRGFAAGLLVGFLLTLVVAVGFLAVTDAAYRAEPAPLPACTDQIADAGGMCQGPLVDDALPPCPTEDSTGCYWDAQSRGNRQGADVVTP
jgi:hypothetical protein